MTPRLAMEFPKDNRTVGGTTWRAFRVSTMRDQLRGSQPSSRRRELLGHLQRTPAGRRKSHIWQQAHERYQLRAKAQSLPYPHTDERSPTILITVARVMPSLTEEIELTSSHSLRGTALGAHAPDLVVGVLATVSPLEQEEMRRTVPSV